MKEIILLCVSITLLVGGSIYFYVNPLYFRIKIQIGHIHIERFAKGTLECDRICDVYEKDFDAFCDCEVIGKKTYEAGKKVAYKEYKDPSTAY